VISSLRQLFVPPDPSLSLLWLIETHYLTAFRIPARFTIALFQAASLFLSRDSQSQISVLLYAISDPCADWCSLALITIIIFPLVNTHPRVNGAILLLMSGFVFSQSAISSWWALGIGNANFAMVGSLVYTAGLILLLVHFSLQHSLIPPYGGVNRVKMRTFPVSATKMKRSVGQS
jgi:hypothetical protein